jgi:hypothetical protein
MKAHLFHNNPMSIAMAKMIAVSVRVLKVLVSKAIRWF